MSYFAFWFCIGIAYLGILYVAYHTMKNRNQALENKENTKNNTHRIGKLEVSLEDLWHIIHREKK